MLIVSCLVIFVLLLAQLGYPHHLVSCALFVCTVFFIMLLLCFSRHKSEIRPHFSSLDLLALSWQVIKSERIENYEV